LHTDRKLSKERAPEGSSVDGDVLELPPVLIGDGPRAATILFISRLTSFTLSVTAKFKKTFTFLPVAMCCSDASLTHSDVDLESFLNRGLKGESTC